MAAIVTKACGPAVTRNRNKRWIREAWRHLQADLAPGLDSVWISRPKAATAGLETLQEEMTRIYRKAGLLGDSQ
jgi:ribonuclease P protein component